MADTKAKTTKTPKAAAAVAPASTEQKKSLHRRTMTGIVVSDKMMKTRVVRIERLVKDKGYGKTLTKMNKFKVHDENNVSKAGDLVSIIESRPLSRDKRWALQKILRKASGEVLTKE